MAANKFPLRVRIYRAISFLGLSTLMAAISLGLSACAVSGPRMVAGYSLGRPTDPDQLTLLSWNVQKAGHPNLPQELHLAIRAHDPDLLFLQEARPHRMTDQHVSGILAPAWRVPFRENAATGVFTASRQEPVESQAIRSRGREFGITFPKAALVTRHELNNGRTLLAINVHALNFEHGKPNRFARQMETLRSIMKEHEGPLIFAGDFNTWNTARDEHLRNLADSLGLREVNMFTRSRKTGDQGSAFLNGLLGIDPTLPLDRIFYRDLRLASARVLNLQSSDHDPLLVTFSHP